MIQNGDDAGRRATVVVVLHHDGVAEREQLEELRGVFVLPGSNDGDEGMIHELELPVGLAVPAPVHRLTRE